MSFINFNPFQSQPVKEKDFRDPSVLQSKLKHSGTPPEYRSHLVAASYLGCFKYRQVLTINGKSYVKFVTDNGKDACFILLSDTRKKYLIRAYSAFQSAFYGTNWEEKDYASAAISASSNGYHHFDKFENKTGKFEINEVYACFKTKTDGRTKAKETKVKIE